MKSESSAIKYLMAAICLAVIAYFGLQVYSYYHDPLTTAVAYDYQVEESIPAAGWVVRSEQVLTGETTGLLRLSRAEGEKVSKGGEIARVYADQASLDTQNDMAALETRLSQLRYAQAAAAGGEATVKLDSRIGETILALRKSLTADRLDAADGQISELRALVLKRDYTYTDDEDLETQITDAEAKLKELRSRTAASIKTVRAPESGLYSAVVDGYETVLTPDFLTDLTPAALSAVQPVSSGDAGLGKLILGDTWYYAATLSAADAGELEVGKTLTLRFTKGDSRELRVKTVSLSKAENSRVAAVFSCRQYLAELTLLRRQSADLIRGTVEGLRVPELAIRVSDDGVTGLYCVVGAAARFKPVTVLYDGDGFALVKSAAQKDTDLLRAGDEVIVTAKNLYDGKVVG